MKSVEIAKRGRGRPKKRPVEVTKTSSSSSTSATTSDSDSNSGRVSDVDSSQEGSQKNQSSSLSTASLASTSSSSSLAAMAQVVKTGTLIGDSSEPPRAPGLESASSYTQSASALSALCQSGGSSVDVVDVQGRNGDSKMSKVETRWGCFGQGEKVFAYWKGNTQYSTGYYSGTIKQKDVLNVYKIHFDDDTVSNTSEAQILPIRVLGVGVKVFYLTDDLTNGTSGTALVIGQKFLDSSGGNDLPDLVEYVIKFYDPSNTTIVCKRRQLYLGKKQANELRKKYDSVQPKFGDVNLDNVILQPRQRAAAKPIDIPMKRKSLPEKSTVKQKTGISGNATRKSVPSKKKRTEKSAILQDQPIKAQSLPLAVNSTHTLYAQDSVPTLKVSERADNSSSLSQVQQKFQHQSSNTAKQQVKADIAPGPLVAQDRTQSTTKTSTKNTDLTEVKLPGEINSSHEASQPNNKVKRKGKSTKDSPTKTHEVKGNLFLGCYFFLTAGEKNLMKGEPTVKEISKSEIQRMISSHQGNELLSLGEEKNKDPSKVFLLASCHLRTLKYLYCVATGIPCVAQKWMEDCINSNSLIDWKNYQLSPGLSLETNKLAQAHKNFPLENMTIGLATYKTETVSTWKTLIPAAKATVKISTDFQHDKQPAELKVPEDWLNGAIDILVSDFVCSKEVRETLKSKGIPLVRIEWLVQTIIMGKKCDYSVGEGWNH